MLRKRTYTTINDIYRYQRCRYILSREKIRRGQTKIVISAHPLHATPLHSRTGHLHGLGYRLGTLRIGIFSRRTEYCSWGALLLVYHNNIYYIMTCTILRCAVAFDILSLCICRNVFKYLIRIGDSTGWQARTWMTVPRGTISWQLSTTSTVVLKATVPLNIHCRSWSKYLETRRFSRNCFMSR